MHARLLAITVLSLAGLPVCVHAAGSAPSGAERPDRAQQGVAEIDSLLTPESVLKLEKGEVIAVSTETKDPSGHSRGTGHGIILIERSFEPIWEQLCRPEEYHEFFPHSVSSEPYFQEGNQVGLRETVRALFMTFRYHVIHTRDKESGTIRWRLDHSKPNDIAETTGSWVIRRHGDHACIVIYSVSVDSGTHIPKIIEDIFQNQSLRGMVKALKKRMESPPA